MLTARGLSRRACGVNFLLALILEDRREDAMRGVPDDAIRETMPTGI
jgi:hypothetical protein